MCVQEEERLLFEKGQMVNLTTSLKNKKNQVNQKKKISTKPVINKESKCSFYKRKGHIEKDCTKFRNWLGKKSNYFALICYEI